MEPADGSTNSIRTRPSGGGHLREAALAWRAPLDPADVVRAFRLDPLGWLLVLRRSSAAGLGPRRRDLEPSRRSARGHRELVLPLHGLDVSPLSSGRTSIETLPTSRVEPGLKLARVTTCPAGPDSASLSTSLRTLLRSWHRRRGAGSGLLPDGQVSRSSLRSPRHRHEVASRSACRSFGDAGRVRLLERGHVR